MNSNTLLIDSRVGLSASQKRLLSYGGKEVFSKVVLQSLPTYTMFVSLVPKGMTNVMESKMQNY